MALNQTYLDSLDEMIAEGVLQAQYGDKTIRFDSFDELVKRRNYIAMRLGQAQPSRTKLADFDPDL